MSRDRYLQRHGIEPLDYLRKGELSEEMVEKVSGAFDPER